MRPDTIFGASFVAVAADHPIAQAHAADSPEVAAFIARCKQGGTTAAEIETQEKLGFDTGLKARSEEHTSELQSLMRISYAVFCLKKKKNMTTEQRQQTTIIQRHNTPS